MIKRLLAFAAGFAFATLVEAALPHATAHAQTYNPHVRNGGFGTGSTAPIWTGVYAGGHLGGASGSIGTSDAIGNLDLQGFAGGIHGGYNFQRGSLLLGIEADATWSGADQELKSGTESLRVSNPWLASVRGRLGLVHDSWLFFVTGGLAFAELKADYKDTDPAFLVQASTSKTDTGYVIGAGIEKKFSSRISARGEILHYGFSDFGKIEGSSKLDLDMTVVRAGLSMHMN
jgi:outer membrane immunogenic protein